MADHSKPVLTSTYTNFVSELDARFDDLAVGLDPAVTTATNIPTNSIRWNSALAKWQKWSGAAWGDLSASYNFTAGAFTTLSATGNTTVLGVTASGSADNAFGLSAVSATSDLQFTGYNTSVTGAVIEARRGSTYKNLTLNGVNITLGSTGAGQAVVSTTGLSVTGALSATGQIKAGSGGATPTAQLANVTPSGTEASIELYQTGVESWKIKNLASSTDLVFANSGTERLRLVGSGGVNVTGALNSIASTGVFSARIGNSGTGAQNLVNMVTGEGGSPLGVGQFFSDASNNLMLSAGAGSLLLGIGGAEKVRVDTSGNLGLGVTPSAWASFKVMQFGNGTADTFIAVSGNQGDIGVNAYYNAGWKYQSSGVASSRYEQGSGTHTWFTAPSGTAGTAITFTQAMTLAANSELNIDSGTGGGRLTFTPGATQNQIASTTTGFGAYNILRYRGTQHQWLDSAGTQAMTLDASGNLGLGVTPSASSIKSIQIGPNLAALYLGNNGNDSIIGDSIYVNAGFKYAYSGVAVSFYEQTAGSHRWYSYAAGTSGNAVSGGAGQAMTLDASGNLLVNCTSLLNTSQSGFTAATISGSTQTDTGHANLTASGATYSNFRYNTNVIGSITQNGTTGISVNSAANLSLTGTSATLNTGSGITTLVSTAAGQGLDLTGSTTNSRTMRAINTGSTLHVGVESSAGNQVFSGSAAYSGIVGTSSATSLHLATNGTVRATINSSGVFSTTTPATTDNSTTVATTAYARANDIGVDQTWQSPSRAASTTYTNTTGKPILFAVTFSNGGNPFTATQTVDSTSISTYYYTGGGGCGTMIVPPGSTYSASGATLGSWIELR